jgi:uncharacterized protein YfcZ (UPF0381/DUF406 family)
MPETVYSILVIDSGVLKYSAVFRNEAEAEQDILRYMKKEYDDLVDDTVSSYEELVEAVDGHGGLDLHFQYEPLL